MFSTRLTKSNRELKSESPFFSDKTEFTLRIRRGLIYYNIIDIH